MWHVSSRSGVATLRTAIHLLLTYLLTYYYLNIYWTDLHEICMAGRTLAVDEPTGVIFFDLSRDVAVATNSVSKIDLHSTRCSSRDIR